MTYKKYVYNNEKDKNGFNEVHLLDECKHLPDEKNRVYLNERRGFYDAAEYAESLKPDAKFDGCHHCLEKYHRG